VNGEAIRLSASLPVFLESLSLHFLGYSELFRLSWRPLRPPREAPGSCLFGLRVLLIDTRLVLYECAIGLRASS
jgi:hypothetical protein